MWGLLLGLLLLLPAPVQAASGTHLYIPRLALSAPVGECALVDHEYDTTRLGNGVCHLEGTATIDHDWARIVLAGHTPGAFSDLPLLRPGDDIVLWNARAVEVYRVELLVVVPVNDTSWLYPTATETLVLITCTQNAQQRLIVQAKRRA
jgi:sortase A